MSRGKPIQVGPAVTARRDDVGALAAMAPAEIREKGLFPKGFLPLPHPKHDVGGMVFPQMEIKHCPGSSGSTSTSICPSTSCPSSRRPFT